MQPSELLGDRRPDRHVYPVGCVEAVIYVSRVEDVRLDEVVQNGLYLKATQEVLDKHGGLWFDDETFVVSRPPSAGRPDRDQAG